MALILHYHPLSSFCWKVLIPLYEKGLPFERVMIDFANSDSTDAFRSLWPMAKMPVLVDEEGGVTLPESSIIIEYLERLKARPSFARVLEEAEPFAHFFPE